MLRIDVANARVKDSGYGLEINGKSLEDLISTALGTKLGDMRAGYGSDGTLKAFECNSCDISITINPHPTTVQIENDEYKWDSVESMEEDLNELYKEENAKAES